MNNVLLIDGLNVVRCIHEANPAPPSKSKAEGAIRASKASIRRALLEHSPTHCALVFDYGGKNWRHSLYADYKVNRKPMPVELADELQQFYAFLEGKGWAVVRVPNQEADDVLGALACQYSAIPDTKVTVLSNDKDLPWLVSKQVKVFDHFNGVNRNEDWVAATFGVKPELIHEWQALVGDTSDGIPGVPKIGAKTATKLINEYGSLESVLLNADAIKGAMGDSIRNNKELARLSLKLTKPDLASIGNIWLDDIVVGDPF